MTEPRVRVPLDGWNADERRRLLALAAGALLDIRWEGDEAVLVDAADEERVRGLAASIRADTPESATARPRPSHGDDPAAPRRHRPRCGPSIPPVATSTGIGAERCGPRTWLIRASSAPTRSPSHRPPGLPSLRRR